MTNIDNTAKAELAASELLETRMIIKRVIETLDYVYNKLDEAAGIANSFSMDVETQRDMLDTAVTHLFNYLDTNLRDI